MQVLTPSVWYATLILIKFAKEHFLPSHKRAMGKQGGNFACH